MDAPRFPPPLSLRRTIDDETLAKMEARAAAATPGPWRVSDDRPDDVIISSADGEWLANVSLGPNEDGMFVNGQVLETADMANGEFIAAARSDVPALTAEVKRLLLEVSYLHDCIEGKDM
jgi:hypothetical protein